MNNSPAIALKDITVIYDKGTPTEVVALKGVTLTVERRERLVVTGGNGSGKSTLLRAIAGTVPIAAGELFLNGRDATRDPAHRRFRRLAFVHQDPLTGTCPGLSVQANAQLASGTPWWRMLPVPLAIPSAQLDALQKSGIPVQASEHLPAGALSGGQRQSLAIALALASRKKIFLFDEFSAALDQVISLSALDYVLNELDRLGAAALFVLHDPATASRIAGRTVCMDNGRIVADGNSASDSAVGHTENPTT